MKIRAAVLYEQGLPRPYTQSMPLKVETLELADPGPGEVLVEIKAAGLCHSDLSTIEGIRPRPLPIVPGHEGAGIVKEVGPGVTKLAVGDHVVFVFVTSCGSCRQCIRGKPHLCTASSGAREKGQLVTGHHRMSLDGKPINHNSGISCFADHAVVAEASIIKIDKDVPFIDAAMFGCAVVTGAGAVLNTASVRTGDTVAVVGLGGVGFSALLAAVATGAEKVVAVDLNPDKLALARQLGATDTYLASDPDCIERIKKDTDGGLEHVIETAGSIKALELAWNITLRGGQTVTAGLPNAKSTIAIEPYAMVQAEKSLRGSYMGSAVAPREVPKYIALYKRRTLPIDRLRNAPMKLDDINLGFERLAAGEVVRQIVLFD